MTIGTFDGVHFGHQKIIEKVVSEAKEANKKSVVLTFFPHPRTPKPIVANESVKKNGNISNFMEILLFIDI